MSYPQPRQKIAARPERRERPRRPRPVAAPLLSALAWATAWAVGVALVAGCASDPSAGAADVRATQPRSIVFPSQPQRQLERLESPRAALAAAPPWYELRNEYRPTVAAGLHYPVLERSITRTWDRQHVHGSRVHDHYHQRTYRETIRRSVR